MNKKFTSKFFLDTFYEIVGEKWMDNNTYLVVFQTMSDKDDNDFHIEAEYHKDDDMIYYSRCYKDEVVDGSAFVSHCFKKQIEEYILQKVGVINENEMLVTKEISVELKLGVPKDMTIGEFQEWLKESFIEVNRLMPTAKENLLKKVKVISINNKGSK
jgi:hypothetical protein